MGDSLESVLPKKEEKAKKEKPVAKSAPPFEGYIAVKDTLKQIATSQIT